MTQSGIGLSLFIGRPGSAPEFTDDPIMGSDQFLYLPALRSLISQDEEFPEYPIQLCFLRAFSAFLWLSRADFRSKINHDLRLVSNFFFSFYSNCFLALFSPVQLCLPGWK